MSVIFLLTKLWDYPPGVEIARRLLLHMRLNKQAPALIAKGLTNADVTSWEVDWFGHDGIDLNEERELELLKSWTAHQSLFAALRADPRINQQPSDRRQIQNAFFPTPDAEIYAAMLATTSPSQVVEVGGGFSTLVARRTIDQLGLATELLVVDPEPRTDIQHVADKVVRACVEDINTRELPLESPALLFIDSTHVIRTGGDIPHLYNRVLPMLCPGSVVQVHDIFIPFDYPPSYQARFYTEQYVLQAMLQQTDRFEVLFAARFMASRYPTEMAHVFGTTVPDPNAGASFWFRVVG